MSMALQPMLHTLAATCADLKALEKATEGLLRQILVETEGRR